MTNPNRVAENQRELQNFTLRAAAVQRMFADVCIAKDNRMMVKCAIPLPKQCSGNTEEVILQGRNGASVFVIDLYVYRKDSVGVKYAGGLTKRFV